MNKRDDNSQHSLKSYVTCHDMTVSEGISHVQVARAMVQDDPVNES